MDAFKSLGCSGGLPFLIFQFCPSARRMFGIIRHTYLAQAADEVKTKLKNRKRQPPGADNFAAWAWCRVANKTFGKFHRYKLSPFLAFTPASGRLVRQGAPSDHHCNFIVAPRANSSEGCFSRASASRLKMHYP
jgi:hypothetical protein